MCIVLFTSAHPKYSLILIDNRDEYVLRPTSRPHWWNHPASGREVLSSRDLQRAAKGTWLGITKTGTLAVLTNYQEPDQPGEIKSRGRVINAWLGGLPGNGLRDSVRALFKDGGMQGVGGLSMVCGKLRRNSRGVAIVSNRAAGEDDVPIIGLEQDGFWGLSNTVYSNPVEWPKVALGKRLLKQVVSEAVSKQSGEEDLIAELLNLLDHNTMPERPSGWAMPEYMELMRNTIFVPPLGDEKDWERMRQATSKGRALWTDVAGDLATAEELVMESRGDSPAAKQAAPIFEEGVYGTQRQTVILVDLEGNVTFVERALYDAHGNELLRGEHDAIFRFKIDGWDDD